MLPAVLVAFVPVNGQAAAPTILGSFVEARPANRAPQLFDALKSYALRFHGVFGREEESSAETKWLEREPSSNTRRALRV